MLQLWFFLNTFWAFSVEIGVHKIGLSIILLSLIAVFWLLQNTKITDFTIKVAVIGFLGMIYYFLIGYIGLCTDKFEKSYLTSPLLLFLVLVGLEVGWRASDDDWLKLQRTVKWILLTAFIGFAVEMIVPSWFPNQAGYRSEGNYSGWFSEPSHVAVSLFPSLVVLLLSGNKVNQRYGVLAMLVLLLLSHASTLIMLCMVWVGYLTIVKSHSSKIVLVSSSVLMVFMLVYVGFMFFAQDAFEVFFAPFIERFEGVVGGVYETTNISSLVYIQGWQDAWANFQRTNGLGLGFNMMGCNPLPDTLSRFVLNQTELNSEDGSFMASKLISELGVIGISLLVIVLLWWIKLETRSRAIVNHNLHIAILNTQAALIFIGFVTLFLRGGGYFNAAFLLPLVAMSASVKRYKISTNFLNQRDSKI